MGQDTRMSSFQRVSSQVSSRSKGIYQILNKIAGCILIGSFGVLTGINCQDINKYVEYRRNLRTS